MSSSSSSTSVSTERVGVQSSTSAPVPGYHLPIARKTRNSASSPPTAMIAKASISRDHSYDRGMAEAVIVDAVRTPIGRYGGVLSSVRPDDLAARVIEQAVERTGLLPGEVDDVILGCTN